MVEREAEQEQGAATTRDEAAERREQQERQGRLLAWLARKGALVLGATVLVVALRLGKNILVSRILEPELRGIWGLLNVVPNFLVSAGNLGIGAAIAYYAGKKLYSPRYTLGAALYSTLTCGTLLGLLALFLVQGGFFFPDNGASALIRPYHALIMAVTPFFWFQVMSYGYLTGVAQVERLSLLRILESGLSLALFLLFLFVLAMQPLDAATYGWFWGFVLAGLAACLMLPWRAAWPPKLDRKAVGDFLSFGLRGHLGNFCNLIILRIDIFFISWFHSPAALGLYMIATSIAELLMMAPEALLIPFTGRLFGAGEREGADFSRNVLRMVFWGMTLLCLLTMLFAWPLILLLFGRAYLPAWTSVLALTPGMLCLSLFYILKVDMNNRGRPGITSVVAAIAAAVNTGLNWLLVPRWGIVAAACTSTFSYLLCALLMLIMYARLNGLSPLALPGLLAVGREERAAIRRLLAERIRTWRARFDRGGRS